jgi:N-acetyl-gamma-glutamyl-phosphate reductase
LNWGIQAIDLSGAFRLEAATFEEWYKLPHSCPHLLSQSKYGLIPWAEADRSVQLISNPGCYATSVLMALIPLIRSKIIALDSIAIDAKSGTSGAGLKANENLLFNEVDSDCTPYRVGMHQHLPEMIRHINQFTGAEIDPHFSTSLLPLRRGIISGLYLKPSCRLETKSDAEIQSEITGAYAEAYRGYPLIKFGDLGQSPSQDKLLLSLKKVAGSPRTHLSYTVQNGKIYVFSLIDNLLKGASSQAVENWNRINGFSIETGLTQSEGHL